MKKTLLLLAAITFFSSQGQTKSTGVVNLTTGLTAKLDLNNTTSTATLTLTGPSDRWFALQFGSFASGAGMQAGKDVVYYVGGTGTSALIDAVHNGVGIQPSTDTNNWTTTSNTIVGSTRTIVATRAFNTSDSNDYTFVYANSSIDFAYAKMSSATFTLQYHGGGNRGYAIDVPFATLGIDGFEKSKISFSPNPTNNSFSIQSDDAIKSVRIYDTTGKQVSSFEHKKESIDISNLPAGIYFVEVENVENKVFTEKIIKK